MRTVHADYPAIMSCKGIRFDAYSGTGTLSMLVDDREARVEVRRQIEAMIVDEFAGVVTGIYLQERLWSDVQQYQVPVRVTYYTVLRK